MASISSDYSTASSYEPAQMAAANNQAPVTQATSAIQTAPVEAQTNESYSSQAYQMTLGNASMAQQSMQTLQSQNHLIEQMNAGFGGDEV